jgi:phosphate transport system permease protein
MSIFVIIIADGIDEFTLSFFMESPREGMTKGGIFPAIIGSIEMMGFSLVFGFPLGLITGVYLSEFAGGRKSGKLLSIIVTSLSGVPSIVYGLFGYALFCVFFGFRTSLLSGSLTLALMTLPVIASSVKEALCAVPVHIRESAMALGANKTEVIFKIVIPYSKTRIITALLLGCGRIIGETAPILLTGTVFYSTHLADSVLDPVMTLPSHIYYLTVAYGEKAQWMAKGSSSVLLLIVLLVYSVAFFLRRKKQDATGE